MHRIEATMPAPISALLRYLLFALLLLIGTAVVVLWTLPAAYLYQHFDKALAPLRLQGIDGTLWQGNAAQISYAAVPLGRLQWTLARTPLLGGSADGELELNGAAMVGKSQFSAQRHRLDLTNTELSFPASLLAPVLDIPALVLLGTVSVTLSAITIEHGIVQSIQGHLVWDQLGVGGAAAATLGSLRVDFEPRPDGRIIGRIRDQGGPLRAKGTVELKGQHYQLEVELDARAGAEQIRETLLYIGERRADGGSLLRVTGNLQKLF
ncbi:MAG: hypothetical protein COS34_15185 [Lysobacterales bacterium CG02_land_8_20_14_3_00_62_12]|nr:MAG: hypothetical protein COS34_15185 [Xanthomonadales bacterium CG02_land_8_20_14_3_00_62_12]